MSVESMLELACMSCFMCAKSGRPLASSPKFGCHTWLSYVVLPCAEQGTMQNLFVFSWPHGIRNELPMLSLECCSRYGKHHSRCPRAFVYFEFWREEAVYSSLPGQQPHGCCFSKHACLGYRILEFNLERWHHLRELSVL